MLVTECRVSTVAVNTDTAVRPVEQDMLAFCGKWLMGEGTLDPPWKMRRIILT